MSVSRVAIDTKCRYCSAWIIVLALPAKSGVKVRYMPFEPGPDLELASPVETYGKDRVVIPNLGWGLRLAAVPLAPGQTHIPAFLPHTCRSDRET